MSCEDEHQMHDSNRSLLGDSGKRSEADPGTSEVESRPCEAWCLNLTKTK